MSAVVVLAGGSPHAHDFAASGAALADLAASLGHRVEVAEHPDQAAAMLTREGTGVDALAVLGLWWRMEGPAYDRWRDAYAYHTPSSTRQAVGDFVYHGGGLLALHSAPICFDDWPGWGDIVGGSWRWGVSSHPPAGPVSAHVVGDHPVVAGLPERIDLDDEVYGDLAVDDAVEVLAVARRHSGDDPQPVVWTHSFGSGRVVFDGFGHDARSICDPHHARLVGQALSWITEEHG